MERGVVSKTLDYAYDDWCVAQLAFALGKKKEGKALQARSMNYKNVFHPEKKFVMQRDSLGNWDPDFNVFSNKGFIEGNSWQSRKPVVATPIAHFIVSLVTSVTRGYKRAPKLYPAIGCIPWLKPIMIMTNRKIIRFTIP